MVSSIVSASDGTILCSVLLNTLISLLVDGLMLLFTSKLSALGGVVLSRRPHPKEAVWLSLKGGENVSSRPFTRECTTSGDTYRNIN